MQLITMQVDEIRPYDKNPRNNAAAIDAVKESIKQCGYIAPIILDEDNVILAGHTRFEALKQLGRTEAECLIKENLTEEQKQKYRLLDNKTSEFAEWDLDLLAEELEGLDFDGFDFGFDLGDEEEFDESDLDEEVEKTNVIVSINCGALELYEEIKERLQNLADEIDATVAVKMG